MTTYERTGHCMGEANWHLQFTPAYRRAIFADPLTRELTTAYLLEAAARLGVHVAAINYGPDHVHLFLEETRKVSVADAVRHLKGYSSYQMRTAHRALFSHLLWGTKFWSGGYFYQTVGTITADTVKTYITHSQQKHWAPPRAQPQRTLLSFSA